MNVAGLYALLSPEALPLEGFPGAAKQLAALGVRQIQIRLKAATDVQRLEVQRAVARALGEVADWGGVLVINDRADLAYVLAIEAPELRVGLHLGQDDLSPVMARAVVGPEVVLGLSTHDLEQVRAARGLPVDYIAFGPVYHTATKANPSPIVGVEGLRAACRYADVPVVAIGGITAERARAVYRAGAQGVAVASGLFTGADGELAARVAAYAVAQGAGRMSDTKTVLELLQVTTEFFRKNGVEAARLEAELLLAKALGCDRVGLYVRYDMRLQDGEVDRYRELVRRRARHEPVHYILGTKEFWSLDFEVGQGVLIPRADTEVLVEEVVKLLAPRKDEALRVADVGTGTGCIAIALATELPQASVVAGDIADVPLALAQKNAERLGVAARVKVVRADGLGPLAAAHGPFDVVVSNPPYIRSGDAASLPPHVRQEPREALFAGVDGLDVLRRLVADVPEAVRPGGLVAFEVADKAQADAVVALFAAAGLTRVHIRNDYAGDARVVVARVAESS